MAIQLVLALGLVCVACAVTAASEPVEIGSRLELFVDDYLIEQMKGARLVLQEPTPQGVAIVHDKPWEGNICCYHTVFQDADRCRMYYRGAHSDEKTRKVPHQVVCYAESRDGIHWTKPELGIVEFKGSKKNNIIWNGLGSHNFTPCRDANPKCTPDARYKALASGKGGLFAFRSPDGVHWSLASDKPVITKGAFDSQNLAFWDTVRGRYVDFHRGFKDGVRDIMTCTSKDFLTWTEPVWLEYPGAPKEHLYTNAVTPYYRAPHIFVGFPKRFLPSRRVVEHVHPGVSDGLFMSSRDGRTFRRWAEAFIRPGLQRDRWVCRNNMTAWGIIETRAALGDTMRHGVPSPNELSVYATEGYYSGASCQLRRYTLRIDGFVSVSAPYRGGELVTKPLVFTAPGRGELVINYSTSAAGSIRCEIRDATGKPIPGHTLREADEIVGDQLERAVSWRGRTEVKPLAGKPIRLRFVMKDADLYSLRFR